MTTELSEMYRAREWQKKLEAAGYRVIYEPAILRAEQRDGRSTR